MIQFNQQYIRDYLKPLIRDVLTDMAASEEAGGKPYLKKILNQDDLGDVDKKQFNQDYFLGTQPGNRPFTADDEAPYRQEFLRTLKGHIDILIKLSNKQGMRESILPDAAEGRLFGSHQSLTQNLNDLAIKMARTFEKGAIERQLKEDGKATQDNLKKLADGELKLVEIDGNVQVKSEDELAEMARKEPEKLVVPMVEPDLEQVVAAKPLDETGEAEPAKPELIAKTVKEVHTDIDNNKVTAMKDLLISSGLEVVGEFTIENGIMKGKVRDVELQELEVTIDISKPDYAPDKFIFAFTEVGPYGHMKGKEIPVSRGDIPNLFLDEEGKRKTAEKVFKEHDAQGQMAGEKYTPPRVGKPPIRTPEKELHGPPVPTEEGFVFPKQAVAVPKGQLQPEGSVVQKTSTPAQGVIGISAKAPTAGPQTGKELKAEVKDARIRGPEVVKTRTIQQKKKKVREQKQAAAEGRQPSQRRQPQQQEAQAQQPQQQKKRGNWLAKLAVGVGTGGMGGIFYALFHTATS